MAKDKNPADEVVPEKKSWDDGLAAALPKTAVYFDAVRSEAYNNRNPAATYLEFCVAMRVDKQQDKWRVMHYYMFDLDLNDGKFKAEVASKGDCSFIEAVYQLAVFENMASNMGANKPADVTVDTFPLDKFPELKVYFFDIENYRVAANIEGIAFDEALRPYRRVDGKVFASATFQRSEIDKSIVSSGQARNNLKIADRIEAGILSDIYNSAAAPGASLDDILKVGQALTYLDAFALDLGAFYLGLQRILNKDDQFAQMKTLTKEEKVKIYDKASGFLRANDSGTLSDLLEYILPLADSQLDQAKACGVHVEPFQKHIAECELYVRLLKASQNLSRYKSSLQSPHGADAGALADIQDSVRKAKEKFTQLGGTAEHFDRLQAWVANNQKEVIPPWLVTWFDRYYDQRQKTMKAVQERQANAVRNVKTMSVKVKPPIVE
ncbi:MAG: hypothetical protein HY052_00305 [Proteobacteria bacterium]|nr:hypothetical protein [Pseudomonadota bacterium]